MTPPEPLAARGMGLQTAPSNCALCAATALTTTCLTASSSSTELSGIVATSAASSSLRVLVRAPLPRGPVMASR